MNNQIDFQKLIDSRDLLSESKCEIINSGIKSFLLTIEIPEKIFKILYDFYTGIGFIPSELPKVNYNGIIRLVYIHELFHLVNENHYYIKIWL